MTTTKLPEYDGAADLRAYGEACRATAPAEVAGDGVERALYDSLAAADNQDLPLEEYPARILKVMAEHSDLTLARELRWLANDKHATDEQRAIASRAIAALATRPAPGRDGVDWKAMYRFQTAMRYMDNNAKLKLAQANAMADADIRGLEIAPDPFGADFIRSIEP